MHVLFVEPSFPLNQRRFVRGLHAAGARVTGIGEAPVEALGDELRGWLYGYEQVRSVVDAQALSDAVRRVQGREWVDRLEATVEAHMLAAAKVREACSIPGTSYKTTYLCRDKPAMKEVLREAGVPCAASTGASSADEVRAFVERVGYPVILKPRDGAGAAGTWRAANDDELQVAISSSYVDRGASVAVEEFVEGHEAFYDTLTIGGEVAHEFISHYYPGVLEAMRTRWISPQIITTNRLDAPDYQPVRELGKKVNSALGIETSATHMEWFFGPKGLKFSEIGCRPAGVGAWDLYCAAHEIDLYREWGLAVTHGRSEQRSTRGFAAGMINLRPERDGKILGYDGADEVLSSCREWIIDHHFPPPGSPTQSVEAGYMANAWMRLKHPDFDELHRMMNRIGETLRVRAG
ncbi:MAG: ATP-grasp domain-containing protein [Acidobacteriota bacterium]|nr:ATP-grasp domain-containing protein [Acidobacteriota bacterium]